MQSSRIDKVLHYPYTRSSTKYEYIIQVYEYLYDSFLKYRVDSVEYNVWKRNSIFLE